MKRQESSTRFELFRCSHVPFSISHHARKTGKQESCERGQALLVGIGSSLSLEDTPALELVSKLANLNKDVCAINLEHAFGLLPELVRTHRTIFIVDSLASEGPTGSILILPLSEDIYQSKATDEETGLQFSSTHSISWFDELKLARLREVIRGPITFIGIESKIAFEPEDVQQQLFDHAVSVVQSVLDTGLELVPKSVLPCGTGTYR